MKLELSPEAAMTKLKLVYIEHTIRHDSLEKLTLLRKDEGNGKRGRPNMR